MKKILLIGGEGYIGNIVAQNLLINGYSVISYDSLIYNNQLCVLNKMCYNNYRFVFGDMSNKKILKTLIEEVNAVVLLAGLVGERGVRLSGGQRQRIGIARALYNDPKILVFDEATSALDGITENAIVDAIHNLSHKKTIIMIAHRISTVKQCDQIYIMDKGSIVDSGAYDELMKRNKYFRSIAKS